MTCKKCGHINKNPDAPFCSECGSKLTRENGGVNHKPKKKLNAVTISLLAVIILAIISLSIFFFIGKAKFTPEKAVEAFETAVKDKNYKEVEKLIEPYDTKFEINHENTKTMVDFLNENPIYLELLIDQFKEQIEILNDSRKVDFEPSTFSTVYLTQKGKRWLFFEDYHFKVKPGYIQLSTENEELDLFINDEHVATSEGEYFKDTYGPFMLGEYTVKAVFENEYVTTEEVESLELFETESEALPFTFDMNIKEVRVSSYFDDYDLYINNEKTEFPLKNGSNQPIGNFPLDGSVTLQVGKEFPFTDFLSDEKTIDRDEIAFEEIHPLSTDEQIELMEQLNSTLHEYIDALSKNDPKLLKHGASDNFKKELDKHIEKMSEGYSKTTGEIKEIRYNIKALEQPEFDEEREAYTMTLEAQLFIHETDGILFGWTNFGDDEERDATEFSRDIHVYYDEDQEQWILDSTNTGYYFVFDRDAEVFEFD